MGRKFLSLYVVTNISIEASESSRPARPSFILSDLFHISLVFMKTQKIRILLVKKNQVNIYGIIYVLFKMYYLPRFSIVLVFWSSPFLSSHFVNSGFELIKFLSECLVIEECRTGYLSSEVSGVFSNTFSESYKVITSDRSE